MKFLKEQLTDKPRISAIILHIQTKEVLLEADDIVGLRLDADGTLDRPLVPVGDQGTCAPAIRTHPAEGAGCIDAFNCPHHAGYFLVRTEDYGTWVNRNN